MHPKKLAGAEASAANVPVTPSVKHKAVAAMAILEKFMMSSWLVPDDRFVRRIWS
jgi:hypothetical protein